MWFYKQEQLCSTTIAGFPSAYFYTHFQFQFTHRNTCTKGRRLAQWAEQAPHMQWLQSCSRVAIFWGPIMLISCVIGPLWATIEV